MHIEDLGAVEDENSKNCCVDGVRVRVCGDDELNWDTKRVLIGAGARLLFYPTLFYNVVRNRFQSQFHWWDRIDQFVLLGAVPFLSDVLELKTLGVRGVITLNEHYETLVPSSFYHDLGGGNVARGWTTYVHCKAGRGRSTTIVLCYLLQYKQMTPEDAYSYVRSIRPRVLLASCQWQAVEDYYSYIVKTAGSNPGSQLLVRKSGVPSMGNLFEFDDCSVVVVTKYDLDGYDPPQPIEGSQILTDLSVIYKARVVGQVALARLSCFWLRCHSHQKMAEEQLLRQGSCTIRADQQTGNLTVDIHVY